MLFVVVTLVLLERSHFGAILHLDGLVANEECEARFEVSFWIHDDLLSIDYDLRIVARFLIRLVSSFDSTYKIKLTTFQANEFFVENVAKSGNGAFFVWVDGDPLGSAEIESTRGRNVRIFHQMQLHVLVRVAQLQPGVVIHKQVVKLDARVPAMHQNSPRLLNSQSVGEHIVGSLVE